MLEKVYLLLEILSIILCLCGLYGRKFKIDIPTMMIIGFDIFVLTIVNAGYVSEKIILIIYPAIFVYSVFEFSRNIRTTIINNMLCIAILALCQLVAVFPVSFAVLFINNEDILALSVNVLSFFIIFILSSKQVLKKIAENLQKRDWVFVGSVILCICLLIYIIIKHKFLQYIYLETYIISIVFTLLAVLLTYKIQRGNEEIKEKEIELKMHKVYLTAFEELTSNLRKKQHDLDNHINAIYSQHYTCNTLAELKESQKKYCDYIKDSTRYADLLRLNDPILGGFLYSKIQKIYENGVEVKTDIKMSDEKINIPIYELISILGILLDNAFEAVQEKQNEDKVIVIYIDMKDDKYIFSVKNICDYMSTIELNNMFAEGYSSKGEDRGIGLYNVKEKMIKYGFKVCVNNENIVGKNWISFSIII